MLSRTPVELFLCNTACLALPPCRPHAGVRMDGDLVPADVVVLAMGPWTLHAAKWLPVPRLFSQLGNSIVLKSQHGLSAHALYLHGKLFILHIPCLI